MAFVFVGETKIRGQILPLWHIVPAVENLRVFRWGLSVIFYADNDLGGILGNRYSPGAYIGAQTALFGIACYPALIPAKASGDAGDYHSADAGDENAVLKPMLGLVGLVGATTIFVGGWLCYFTVRRYGFNVWLAGIILILIGGACVTYSTFSLCRLAENVSAAHWIDASATYNGASENVGVFPIKGDHNAKMAFWAEPSLAQKGGVN